MNNSGHLAGMAFGCYYLVHERINGPRDVAVLQVEHNPQSRVDATHIFEAQVTHAVAESTGVDRRGLFSQHARDTAVYLDLGPKACSSG
jgi:hypothetical protein